MARGALVPTRDQLTRLLRARESSRGLLVAFEGADGAGKTTQRKLFRTWLESEGHTVLTSEWSSSSFVRPLIKARKKIHALGPEEFCLLHAADFRHRLEHEILPALWRGTCVIADRYLFTGLARDASRGLPFDRVMRIYTPVFWPDLVFYFSVSPDTSSRRVAADRAPSYYESGQDVTGIADPLASYHAFIDRVMREYDNLALIFEFVTVNAEKSIYDQHRMVREMFQQNRRRPWAEWNRQAVREWLRDHPAYAGETR
jgi:dTMP kinase